MTLFDGLIALGVIFLFGWLMFIRITNKNPQIIEWIKDYMNRKKDKGVTTPSEVVHQTYESRGGMM